MPKTPKAALVVAQTYMYTTQPNLGDPREHMHRAALQGLRFVGNKLTAKEEKWNKLDICKNASSNAHITRVPQTTDCSFHGIVPGSANYPLGWIALDVCFGNRQNYRKEKLNFEVMDWPSQYHMILGQPAFLCFMAVPHYTYLVLKMPGPRRIITVKGSFKLSDLCDKEFHKMAQTFGMTAEYGQLNGKTGSATTTTTKQPKEDHAELEAKKLLVQSSDPKDATTKESGTPPT
jgi:hypothetical protein